jgi:hypothetical protein
MLQIRFFLISVLLIPFIPFLSFAQNVTVQGKTIDDISHDPIPYCSVVLKSLNDTTLLFGNITDNKGEFYIKGIPEGLYKLELSFVGYKVNTKTPVKISGNSVNLGTFELRMSTVNLDDIQVNSSRVPISYKVDKKVIDAGSFPDANVAMDLLENVASLQVDFDGKLSYRGDGTFKVYINGHPTANGEEKLKQISASKIDRIEVITNPSAKYNAEGTAGIIQVILKKNRLQGYAISSSAKASNIGTYEWLYTIDKKSENGGWYIDGQMANYLLSRNTITETRNNTDDTFRYETHSLSDNNNKAFMNYFEFGLNYDLTDKDYIDFSVNVNPLKSNNKNRSTGKFTDNIYNLDSQLISSSPYLLNNTSDLSYRYLGAILTYEHSFDKDQYHKLKSYVDFSTYLHPLNEKQVDNLDYPNYSESNGFIGKEYNEIILEAKLGYENQLSDETSIEFGGELTLDHIPQVSSVSGQFDSDGILTPFPNEPLNQKVDFVQDIYSGYLLFKSGIGKFEYQLGLRTEFTSRKSDYSYSESDQRVIIPAEKKIVNYFPSIHTVYSFSKDHQIACSFTRRINRPDYLNLIPLSRYETIYSYYTGNGYLKPSYANSFEVAYKKSWEDNFVGCEFFARNTQQVIQIISRVDSVNVLVESPENVGSSWSSGGEIMFGYDFFNWWNANLSSSLYTYQLNISIDNQNRTETQLCSDHRLNNTFILPKSFKIKWDFNYKSPELAAQGKRDGYYYSSLALQKGFRENKWLLVVVYSNIFNDINYTRITQGTNFYIRSEYDIRPSLSLKVSYKFDNQE